MTRTFRSGASLHSLLTDAPVPSLLELLATLGLGLDLPVAGDDGFIRQSLLCNLGELAPETARKLNDLAGRLLTLGGRGAETLLMVARARLSRAALAILEEQPGPLGRAIHLWRQHRREFEDAESLQHAEHYRDFSPIFSAFDAPVDASFAWDEATEARLRDRIVAELQLEGPVRLSHLEVPHEGEDGRNHVVIVRHGGLLASVATHGQDGGKDWYYYRPSTEVTLIYSPVRGVVEVCAPSPSIRQDAARAFAEAGLGQDLSSKPLSFKLYDLSRFRSSLALPHHQPDGLRVERVSVVEAEVCLGHRARRLRLTVPAEDDLEAVATECFGDQLLRRYPVVRVGIAIEYWPEKGRRTRTLKLVLSEPNRCNLRGNKDRELRKLGYDLLEHWGVLRALQVLGPDDRRRLLPSLLALYDLGSGTLLEHDLNARGFDVEAFAGHGFVEPAGRLANLLLDEDDGGPALAEVRPGIAGTGEYEDAGGRTAWQPKALVRRFRVHQDWVRETVVKELLPALPGRPVATAVPELHRLGEVALGEEPVAAYLARGLSDFRVVRRIEDHLRGGATPGVGLILSAGEPGLRFIGANVVLEAADFLRDAPDGPALDLDQLRLAYLAGRQRARNGSVVELARSGDALATLHVPGRPPLSVTGEKQVAILRLLVDAYHSGVLLVSTSELLARGNCRALSQAFDDWQRIEDVYIGSPRRGYWQLLV